VHRSRILTAEADTELAKMNWFKKFMADDSGATAIEYGLLSALLGVAIISASRTLGTKLSATFANITGNL
jgi:pilus assembly protein Flp/PilA